MKGKLVVIEGADASGKKTQSRLLVESLRSAGKSVELVSFPRYNEFFGGLIKEYLQGKFGSKEQLPVEFVSLLYSLDRFQAKPMLEKWLAEGKIVVCDRFSASNIAHQAAKLSGARQKQFIRWLSNVESELPKPDLTIYLDVPVEFSQSLMQKEGRKKDLHESDAAYLEKARVVYLQLARQQNWVKIDCVKNRQLLSIAQIHSLIWKKLFRYL
ncbi:MAG: dTMP kinase [Candidatus Diapherotrites archaeon]|nr:dTMP kinase [Candidatus Diapherotrites archaeon]